MRTYTLEINPLQKVPASWLLPLEDQEPTNVDGPISRYAGLDEGLHEPEFIKLNESRTWTSVYYYEIGGRISIFVAERDPKYFYGSDMRIHGVARSLQTSPEDAVKIMHEPMDFNHALHLQAMPAGLREIFFIHYHHPNQDIRDNIADAVRYMNTAGKDFNDEIMQELLYGTAA